MSSTDDNTPTRASSTMTGYVSAVISFVLGALAIYSAGFALIDPKLHRASVFALALIVAIAVSRRSREQAVGETQSTFVSSLYSLSDVVLLVGGVWAIYTFFVVQTEMEENLYSVTSTDSVPAIVGLIVFLELCRRTWGLALFLVGALAVLYLAFGSGLPSIMAHAGFNEVEIAENLWFNMNKGVFGSITNIVINIVFVFIVFGTLLEGTGAGDTLLKFAFRLTRRTRGGPAHAAILASSLFGTMSGSTVANIVGTGTFTIPMIKRRGFSPAFAAGIEATASSGGQIMPPIMGAAALVMADLTGISYLLIIVAALVPALAYYFSLFCSVTAEARRQGIEVQPLGIDDQITRQDILNSIMFLGPILTVIAALILGYSTARAGFWAVVVLLVLSFANPDIRRDPFKLIRSIVKGGESGATLLIAIATIGIVVGALDSTGLGLKLANVIASVRGESLFSALLLAMIGALVLGMGMPTLPAYLIIILVMGPAIQQLGVSVLTAHMFVFYYGVASSLTPPVAIAAYAAAPIAGANPLATAVMSFRLGMAKFVIPFIFAFYPVMLIVEEFSLVPFLWVVARTMLFIWLFSTALSRYDQSRLTLVECALRLIAGFAVLVVDPSIQFAAIALAALLIGWDVWRQRSIGATV
ncbi:MAG: TRAP transporter fused permease subunit [Hyphomicrobiaceae bacterium]